MKGLKFSKLVIVQRIFPHYRRAIFSALAERYTLRLMHGVDRGNIPQTSSSFSVECKNYFFGKVTYQSNILFVAKAKPDSIVQEFSISFLNLYASFFLAKLFGAKFILWGHGYDREHGFHPDRKFSDKLRLFFIKNADAVILYSDDVKDELSVFAPDQIFTVARNSIDSVEKERIFSHLRTVESIQTNTLKLCFVARLSENKKVELLSKIALSLKEKNIPFVFTIVGDGECGQALVDQCRLDGVSDHFEFLGSIYEEELVANIIYNSDFMVVPAWCGLSINHSFCYGTPMATLIKEQHPPEIQFAKDGYNAVLANSIEELVSRLIDIKNDGDCLSSMRQNARRFYEEQLSISSMLKGFTEAISGNEQ